MKQNCVKIISFITALTIFISCYCINIYASESEELPHLNTYAANYFHRLNNNFGLNNEGSCGYVAAGMLLSFYDSYLNDNFIQEVYDNPGNIQSFYDNITSSGIKREADWEDVDGYTNYDDFIDENANSYFHLKLLKIVKDNPNIINQESQTKTVSRSGDKPDQSKWTLSLYEVKSVIEKYFSDYIGNGDEALIIKNNVTVHVSCYNDSEHQNKDNPNADIRTEMIAKIKLGIPVIYFGKSKSTEIGHFMIGYDYDEETDTIYFHTGWKSDTSMTDKEAENFIYTANTGFLWFEVNDNVLSHSHSNNYVVTATNESFCACKIYSSHPSHSNNHQYVKMVNDETYYEECFCGAANIIHYHTISYSYTNPMQHYRSCDDCTYYSSENHNYAPQNSTSASGHQLGCVCGANKGVTESHYEHEYTSKSFAHHYIYCECGYLIGTETHTMRLSGTYNVCQDCGYSIKVSGGVTLDKIEEKTENR